MVTAIFDFIAQNVTEAVNAVVSLFDGVAKIFVLSDETGGITGLSFVGILALLGFGIALVRWGFSIVMRLIKMGGKS